MTGILVVHFGLGFYLLCMVAEKVELLPKPYDAPAVIGYVDVLLF